MPNPKKPKKNKLLLWWWMPTHHQSAFFKACCDAGIDLKVHYFGRVIKERIESGWADIQSLPPNESFVSPSLKSLEECNDWRERIHIVPGYGTKFLCKLVRKLCRESVAWIHWSEPSNPGLGWQRHLRWAASYPLKYWHACMINRHSLGAFATGDLAERDFKRWGVKEKKIYFLPYAVNKPIVCEPDPVVEAFVRDRNLVFMHLGTLEHRKGIDVIMNAFSQVAKNKPSVCLVLVGKDCNNGGYNRLAKTLNLQDQILFKGTVLATSISSVVALTDVLVLASRHDGWGVVLNEAAATGKALLSTDMCSAAYHLIKEGINGFKVSSGSIGELASKMAKYISNPGMAKRHGQASLAIYEDFTPERNVERLMEGIACMQSKR